MKGDSPRLSVDRIMENFSVDRDFVISLLDEALKSLQEEMCKLKDAVNRNDKKIIEITSHTIKGVSLNLYLERLPVLCKKMELSSDADQNELFSVFEEVEKEYLEVKKEIEEVVDNNNSQNDPGH